MKRKDFENIRRFEFWALSRGLRVSRDKQDSYTDAQTFWAFRGYMAAALDLEQQALMPQPIDGHTGCGACGDGCKGKPCQLKEESPACSDCIGTGKQPHVYEGSIPCPTCQKRDEVKL